MDSPQPREGNNYTRRSFVKRTGVMGGALWLLATGWDKTIGRAVAALSPSAEARHRRTYEALADAVSASDANPVQLGGASASGGRFDDWYSRQPLSVQRTADSLLEDLEHSIEGEKFSKAGRDKRVRHMRERANGPRAEKAHADKASPRRAQQVRENAARLGGDPTDFEGLKPVEPDEPAPKKPKRTKEDTQRVTFMNATVALAVAPLYMADPDDPDDLRKVPEVLV